MRISKIIVALLVSVVALAAMTGVAVALPGDVPDIHAWDTNGNEYTDRDGYQVITFENNEDVYAKGRCEVTTQQADFNAKVVIMPDQTSWTDQTDLSTSNVAVKTVTIDYQTGRIVGEPVVVWSQPLTDGDYDIIISCDNDLVYDSTTDDVENCDVIGLMVVPEFATIAIPAIAVLGLFLFFNKRKHKKD